MIQISYTSMVVFISIIWCLVRVVCATKAKRADWKREIQLLLVYVCIVVVARFAFFPFSKVNGEIQPLVYESAKVYPFRINWIPFVNLFDYPEMRDILINVIGNTAMFIPLGVVWPSVYKGFTKDWIPTGKLFPQALVFLYVLRFYNFPFMTGYPMLMIYY